MTQAPRTQPLHGLIQVLPAVRILNPADPQIAGLTSDSRAVVTGMLFVAVRGEKLDRHTLIGTAAEQGAAAIVCETPPRHLPACPVIQVPDCRRALSALSDRFYGHPSTRLRVTGVTGTDGKTSTTEILRAILSEAGRPAASIGTLGYCIGGRWIDSPLTTPDPVSLHSAFGRMVDFGVDDVCMEVSSHSLVQQRVADVDFDAAVLTNITQDHLDTHGTRQEYARAKRILFERMAPGTLAVLPAGDEFTDWFREATSAEVLTYSMKSLSDVRGNVRAMGMQGMEVCVRTPFESYLIRTSLTGSYNCLNILAAATVAFGYGIGGEVVKEALRGFRGVPGRLERVFAPGRSDLPAVCVDYAHTPGALENVLGVLRPLVKGKLICVVGCGGDRDRTKRPMMGRIAAQKADLVIFTADNSRSERTEDIIEQMVAGIQGPHGQFRVEPDRRRAIETAIEMAPTSNSMVAICGRGCERYQKLGSENIPFDDRHIAQDILTAMPLRRRRTA
jgi:UDP-N-acetylmuramoyl-L-alanyl-D-glutamate--2,6-diaminopimelate ligase